MAGSIKLYGPTGYTELAAGIGADDNVLTLPVSGSALASDVDLATKLDTTTAASTYLPIAGGKILQVVRATDSTQRSTTSTSLVDASISVTITPQKSTSAVILIWGASLFHTVTSDIAEMAITDASNNAISGAEGAVIGSITTTSIGTYVTAIGYSTPATTAATTYKGRFKVQSNGTATLFNNITIGQLYAIEVSA
jgi:hypothetical protein